MLFKELKDLEVNLLVKRMVLDICFIIVKYEIIFYGIFIIVFIIELY